MNRETVTEIAAEKMFLEAASMIGRFTILLQSKKLGSWERACVERLLGEARTIQALYDNRFHGSNQVPMIYGEL